MSATLVMDGGGRVVLPKPIRDRLNLRPGAKIRLEMVGDTMQLTQEVPELKIIKRGKRRVVGGWEGFDAAKAVNEMRENQVGRLDSGFTT